VKISIITAVYNRSSTIADAMISVRDQAYQNLEHVVVDGLSTDSTLQIIRGYLNSNTLLISEADDGMYEAINKGINLSTGDIVGVLHSDDVFSDSLVLKDVAECFSNSDVDVVYGDLVYVDKENPYRVRRFWQADKFSAKKLAWGWMPPHPTLFIRRRALEKLGYYDESYQISADYDFILRYFSSGNVFAEYIPRVLVRMRLGGKSNRSIATLWTKTVEDYRALRRYRIGGFVTILVKNLRKIPQFFTAL
jgi:glycosyltransferase